MKPNLTETPAMKGKQFLRYITVAILVRSRAGDALGGGGALF